ncbi:DUF4325 domain-containing protein [Patescibacteria group bacterium]|nr:DUF4325 domain-containing protein [Patescibacteria group bacterium]MBU1885500.1 DUF4325 domain-containing protein [Patescibacteria group bacterium]
MSIKQAILELATCQKKIKNADVLQVIKHRYSRQSVAKNLRILMEQGSLVKFGAGAGVFYTLPQNVVALDQELTRELKNENLQEDQVFTKFSHQLNWKQNLKPNVYSILSYAFSEMLNNAIEHSASKKIKLSYKANKQELQIIIRDLGVGVFAKVKKQRHLASELEAIQDIFKGKVTTDPIKHSGQGIFFTSKAVKIFSLESHWHRVRVDNTLPDIFVEKLSKNLRGTRVTLVIDKKSPDKLVDVFKAYQTDLDGYDFDKTKIWVKLFTQDTVYVSRSQARRILEGLDQYQHIILDFDQVRTVGQAFADEIFRVFAHQYPQVILEPVKMNDEVEFMVRRVTGSI